MVELALVLPLLVVLSLGVVDLGRAYWLKARLVSAAGGGSTYAQYNPSQVSAAPGCSDPYNVVYASQHEEGSSNGFSVVVSNASSGGAPISGCNTMTIPPGTLVTVAVSAPFKMLTPILSLVMSGSTTLRASSEVVVQG
jgi:Flp pilus assembly protein TadG